MKLNKDGFSFAYHHVCAFELNDQLRDIIKDCPDAAKSSHAVFYGYVDEKQGLMLELLGGGKQAPKYFYFKAAYTGERVSVPAAEIADVEFMYFPKVQKAEREKFAPRIAAIVQDSPSEAVEKLRGEDFAFLGEFRDLSRPDVVRVILRKDGLRDEEVPVLLTGEGDHCLEGIIQKDPEQPFGYGKGDAIRINARELENDAVEIFARIGGDHELTQEDLDDGSFIKFCLAEFMKDQDAEDKFAVLLRALRSGCVVVPCDAQLSDKAAVIAERLEKEGKSLDTLEGEDLEIFRAGVKFIPLSLKRDGRELFPVFTDESEIPGEKLKGAACLRMPFLQAMESAEHGDDGAQEIVVNAFTDNFIVPTDVFENIRQVTPFFGETMPDGEELPLAIDVGRMDVFNYALYRNRVDPIQDIRILNRTGESVSGLSLRITSDAELFRPFEEALPEIPSGKPISVPNPQLRVNVKELAALTESVPVQMKVELVRDGEVLCGVHGRMNVLAYDQWMGGAGYRQLLPAFVIPNHPAIPALMHDAAERLAKWGKPSALDAYQSHDPNRVRDLAAAAYAAIQKKNIVYAEPPKSFFEEAGQQIRTPETIMEQRLGTCMDMTLLYAALLEGMGLHPLLVMIHGHIFAGVWLKERTEEERKAANVIIDDIEQLTMRIDNGTDELTFVECTAMCAGKQVSFEEAEDAAKHRNLDPAVFEMAIDVFLSRSRGIRPISPRVKDGSVYQIEGSDKEEDELTAAPSGLGLRTADASPAAVPGKITDKRTLWESKLLDLSTRNMLLNLPLNASVVPIMSSHIDELEDALADGHEFYLQPVPEWIGKISFTKVDKDGTESKPIAWLPAAIKERGVFEVNNWPAGSDFDFNEKFRQEYRNHRLYTFCAEKQLDRELTGVYRAARAAQQENGVSSLYLAVGLLRWFPADSSIPCYAPLILIPIEIVRKSANQGYALHERADEPHFNSTLQEMLRQNYNLHIGGLDPLPLDEHGLDIKKIFALVRSSLFTVKGWDVVETCVIGNFSFAQFAMWNDIHTAGAVLENSDIVRSLMKGHVDWDVTAKAPEPERMYLPITVDDTQLQAIKMAAQGTSFVLHGPPGTGKSQTITGMIANLMAQGKKVLFVAEKMAALSVVQKRLASLGIGDFCLELHSDKANKKQVLTQLEKALAIKRPERRTEYEEYLHKAAASREKLDSYSEHLHRVYPCGFSLRELIDLFETVRGAEHYVRFDIREAGKLTKEQIRTHLPLIGRLTAAGEAFGDIASNPLVCVGLTEYNAQTRGSLRLYARECTAALEALRTAGGKLADLFGFAAPESKADYIALESQAALYDEKKGTDPMLPELLHSDLSAAYTYFDENAQVLAEQQALLKTVRAEFLSMDMSALQAKHAAAGKKLLGKSSAMAAVTAEVQSFAAVKLSFEQIPALLQRVTVYQAHADRQRKAYAALPEITRKLIDRFGSRQMFAAAEASAHACEKQAEAFPGGLDAIMALAAEPENEKTVRSFREAYARMCTAEAQLDGLLHRRESEDRENWIEAETAFCEYLASHLQELKERALYNQVRQECVKAGLAPVAEAYESGFDAAELETGYKKGLYYALINHIISTDDVLSCFSGAAFNEAVQQFKKLDELMLQQAREEIYYLLASRVPSGWESPAIGTELNLLRKAIGSNARGMSIRTLFDRLPHVLQVLCPCMLMSPNSVAQYLAQDSDLFDVVIFDEASQLPTCKAVGALSRAKSAVIVGDPKQMPPTAFFNGAGPEVDDLALDDLDSILDDALALGIPSQHLQWHYRSTHESLIAFSNNEFYGNKMYTFPSANDRERHVTAVHVEGVYSKSINVKEAEAVVAEIVRRFRDPELRGQSVGVVTFNVKQQTLIENLLAKQYQQDAELDAWANGGDDPLFVKNLENVQGDERDVILFSIGYGPDEKGRISMNFGPINRQGGGKRLNVAFSRARVTMTIFASLYSTDIKITENSPEGLIAFRDFLHFAEGHDLAAGMSAEETAKQVRAGILQNIRKAITEQGYRTETMIGHSDFRVDIAVVDPYEPNRYMLGILLDGDGYRRTKNTRDREVAQVGVLKNLGWILLRVWTVDWWDNRNKVIERILARLTALKARSEQNMQKAQADESARKEAETAREAEAAKLKAELAAQAAEVVAEEEEGEKERRMQEVPAAEPEPQHRKQLDAEVQPVSYSLTELFQKIAEARGEVIDKRNNGGALWIVGGMSLAPIMEKLKEAGICFTFKTGGGKATGGKDGWWAKTDIVLPSAEEEADPVENSDPEPAPDPMTKEKIAEEPVDYAEAILPTSSISQAEFAAPENQAAIEERMLTVLAAEAPILKDTLFRKVWSSFGIRKTTASLEAAEQALKTLKVKKTKQKGIIYCWAADQDPKTWSGIRVSNTRTGEEICQQEIRNAARYVLQTKGDMAKDSLIKEISLLFGYKRLGENLEAALAAGVQYARISGDIVPAANGMLTLPRETVGE